MGRVSETFLEHRSMGVFQLNRAGEEAGEDKSAVEVHT